MEIRNGYLLEQPQWQELVDVVRDYVPIKNAERILSLLKNLKPIQVKFGTKDPIPTEGLKKTKPKKSKKK